MILFVFTPIRFDPNRIFTDTGIVKTLNENNGPYPDSLKRLIKTFADSLLSVFADTASQKCMIAIHNNSPADFSVLSYKNTLNAREVFIAPKESPDDFFIVTDSVDFAYLKNVAFNVVWQSETPEDDGSLSIWAQQHRIPYINIEAGHGHLKQQVEMIKVVYDMVKERG